MISSAGEISNSIGGRKGGWVSEGEVNSVEEGYSSQSLSEESSWMLVLGVVSL